MPLPAVVAGAVKFLGTSAAKTAIKQGAKSPIKGAVKKKAKDFIKGLPRKMLNLGYRGIRVRFKNGTKLTIVSLYFHTKS